MEEDEEADDLFVIGERDTINIDTQLRDAIITLVDPLPLCSPDCAGLCDVCGDKWADLPPAVTSTLSSIRVWPP